MKIVVKKMREVVSGQIVELLENNGEGQINILLSEEVAKRIFKGLPLEVHI